MPPCFGSLYDDRCSTGLQSHVDLPQELHLADQHDAGTAHKIMLHVHTKGIGVAGVFPYETAETKVHQVVQFAREHEMLITVEEGAIGGFGSYVLQTLAEHGALDHGLKVRAMVLPDAFIDQDSPAAMYAKAGRTDFFPAS